jgi:2'-5' RNA ligase
MRLFIAANLDSASRRHLGHVLRDLADDTAPLPPRMLKFVEPSSLHITLKFLGEVPDPRLPDVLGAMKPAAELSSLGLRVSRIAPAPQRGDVRLLVAELEGHTQALADIVQALEDAFAAAGFRREGRAFWAHITLARARMPIRPRDRAAVDDWFAALSVRHCPGPEFPVSRLDLMSSELHREGPSYLSIAHADLP